jgi:hypothetical protein
MRALSIAISLIYLSVGASPCLGETVEKPANELYGKSTDSPHANHEIHASVEPRSHHHQDQTDASSKLRPVCPCGCEDAPAAASSFVRLGYGLMAYLIDPASTDPRHEVLAEITENSKTPLQSIDHVPISS